MSRFGPGLIIGVLVWAVSTVAIVTDAEDWNTALW